MTALLPDHADRARAIGHLDRTLFVEAGAGTGKTTVLVERIVQLITRGGVPVDRLAAITFTEKAAAELTDRVRRRLTEVAAGDDGGAALARTALEHLDAAAIGTLHAFAQRLLLAHPIEAGLPPRIEVLDEIASAVLAGQRWQALRRTLLDQPDLAVAVVVAEAGGVRLDELAVVADELDRNWDLVEDRVASIPIRPVTVPVDDLIATVRDLVAACPPVPGDGLVCRLAEFDAWADRLAAAVDDAERVALLREAPSGSVANRGNKKNWPGSDLAGTRQRVRALAERIAGRAAAATDAAVHRLLAALAEATLEAAHARRRAGTLAFHDLLVLARHLVVDGPHALAVRRRLHERYRVLLIDEFQDTDPIQLELAMRIATPPDQLATGWDALTPAEGALFFVGDPKQSIYRFRRADIELYLQACDRFRHGLVHLRTNFRTVAPLVAWINHVFGRLITPVPGAQPAYVPLAPARPGGDDHRVLVLGANPHDDEPKADALREREATDVAAAIAHLRATARVGDGQGGWRTAEWSDIAVLLPARTSLPFLETALADAGIPYRAESSSIAYATREIRDLMTTLRAVDDPTEGLSLVSALRSPLFGCSDVDLARFRLAGGRFDLLAEPPAVLPADVADGPVVAGLRALRDLHDQRRWSPPSALLDRLVRDRRVLELAVVRGRPRDVWRRVRFVIDQARAWSAVTGGSLRDYLAWVGTQTAEGARVVETVLPETDDDAVRILTVHAAKGLEFPIVVVSGLTTAAQGQPTRVRVLWPPGDIGLKVGKDLETAAFSSFAPIDEQLDAHEKVRLLYVACTRARDHLVVSLHRTAKSDAQARQADRDLAKLTMAALLAQARDGAPAEEAFVPPGAARPARAEPPPGADDLAPLPDLEPWVAARDAALARATVTRTVGASTLAHGWEPGAPAPADDPAEEDAGGEGPGAVDPGLAKAPRDLELPPWRKGRYGTGIGRAVHAVLQAVDLATGDGLEALAAAQAAAEGVLGQEAVVAALARSALAHPRIRDAARHRYWRETYVGAPLDGLVVEGYVDLLYRHADGLVVVDYKTDHLATPADRADRIERYAVQVAAYAACLEAATGEPVARAVLLFLAPEGAEEVVLDGDGLRGARERLRAELAKGDRVLG